MAPKKVSAPIAAADAASIVSDSRPAQQGYPCDDSGPTDPVKPHCRGNARPAPLMEGFQGERTENVWSCEEVEWKRPAEIFSGCAVCVVDADLNKDRGALCVAQLFENSEWAQKQSEFAAFITVSKFLAKRVAQGGFLWESIEARGQVDVTQGANTIQVMTYAVRVLIDSEVRTIIVDDLLPILNGNVLCALMVDTPPVGSEEETRVFLWPALLQKALVFLEYGSPHSIDKCDPMQSLNQWVLLGKSAWSGQVTELALVDTPRNLEWSLLREPRREDFFFSSWDSFSKAKTEAAKLGDEKTVAILNACEQEAVKLKAAEQKAEEEAEAAAAAAAAAAATAADAHDGVDGATKSDKSKPRKAKKSKMKKRKEKGPFNEPAFVAALKTFEQARERTLEALKAPRSRISLLTVCRASTVVLPCSVTASPALEDLPRPRKRLWPDPAAEAAAAAAAAAASTAKGKGGKGAAAAAPKDASPSSESTAPTRDLEQEELSFLGEATWTTREMHLLSGATYAVAEVSDTQARLVGLLATEEEGRFTVDWTVADTFWVPLQALSAPDLGLELQVCALCAGLPSAVLRDHWSNIEGEYWTRSPESNCSALVLQSERESSVITVTVVLSADSSNKEGELQECVLKLVPVNGSEALGSMLDGLGAPGCWTLTCSSGQGSVARELIVEANQAVALSLQAPLGASVRVVSSDPHVKPVFLPLLEAAHSVAAPSATRLQSHTVSTRSVPAGDWRVASRFSLSAKDSAKDVVATVDIEDATLAKYVHAYSVGRSSGRAVLLNSIDRHNAQWVSNLGPMQEETDILLVVEAPANHSIPATKVTFRLLSGADGPDLVQVVLKGAQRFAGQYLPNSRRILFRDTLDIGQIADPGAALSLRLALDEPFAALPFRLQLLIQDINAQAGSQSIGTGDEVIAEVAPEARLTGRRAAELHWLPSEVEKVRQHPDRYKLVLQAVLDSASAAPSAREPFWEREQVPEEYKGKQGGDAVHWDLRTVTTSESVILNRDTAWENSVQAHAKKWEDAEPGRAERGKQLRHKLSVSPVAPETDASSRASLRAQVRRSLSPRLTPDGQFLLPRCPVPRSDDERACLDAHESVPDADDALPERGLHRKRFQEWLRTRDLDHMHAQVVAKSPHANTKP